MKMIELCDALRRNAAAGTEEEKACAAAPLKGRSPAFSRL
jgi:hypothetical protein